MDHCLVTIHYTSRLTHKFNSKSTVYCLFPKQITGFLISSKYIWLSSYTLYKHSLFQTSTSLNISHPGVFLLHIPNLFFLRGVGSSESHCLWSPEMLKAHQGPWCSRFQKHRETWWRFGTGKMQCLEPWPYWNRMKWQRSSRRGNLGGYLSAREIGKEPCVKADLSEFGSKTVSLRKHWEVCFGGTNM